MDLRFSEEVRRALEAGQPLVALETSVVAQGLPYPDNLAAARACEEAIRRAGAVPAATAIIDGQLCVGLEEPEMRRLAEGKERLLKVASRDFAVAMATRATGGTTVSATCEMAAAAGIRVFSTGGIGGVHRGASEHFDISQDIAALARFPVAVVCAGAKSVLDLPKTMELLETAGVPVIGVGTDELPSFYSRGSGIPLEHRADDVDTAARIARARFESLKQGGVLYTVPPPEETSLPRNEVELHIAATLADADRQGIRGKAVTPFLLSEMAKRTGGKTLKANLALLTNNARFAGQLAVAYARAS
ncbi:indigoidine synthase A-like protein [Myxococcus xanthus DK 1622]|uniref:Pseudouridine-5'-phosphate glycosidase n=1 Tax=Myxococcus xanthus (strain DK1622) TaxID=246197 RepID=PSUG_MYXXD|nr:MULTISPECIES: pseudouridine-5'-phosphate glycosidase [Myxococcus]Q1D739.1 RecName: Full=Pseudouridine-5'-phosphate glycosidase; Short=PsiMP glycosidase [Myxococcus xanthus DK 1622]ABF92641.1 indigoidine synthase A-like protein [Myxococcus xanthus DK 1622]NOJ54976.1 pseudouridine-5'-phosphate glycosidase [Myxococcus xanthus]QPM82773.1 pseudouridine-5'-phosphate glycosidase [Myxococcus xanthus]QQR48226.1 pseudouridine-5'-phosphate glycosidase [Myxococcus xanthus]QVW65078.1 pseudouridine-5'-p